MILVTPVCWISALVLSSFNKSAFGWIGQFWSNRMFFNDWIMFFSQTYLFLGMCASINFTYYYFDTLGNGFNSILSTLFGLIIAVGPIFVGVFYKRYSKLGRADIPGFLAKYGNGIEGLNFKR